MAACVFCGIVAGSEPARIRHVWDDVIAIDPLRPITNGHLLVLPRVHVPDATTDPEVSAGTMRAAAEIAVPPCHFITSAGSAASQTVFHLHLHIVPRRDCDGLDLRWTKQDTGSEHRFWDGPRSRETGTCCAPNRCDGVDAGDAFRRRLQVFAELGRCR